jgi:hypothetical protein
VSGAREADEKRRWKRPGDELARPLGEVVAELEQVVVGDEHGGR